jgi:hypothetical protein
MGLQLIVVIIHHWLGKRLILSIIPYKKLHESFQIQITRKFHGSEILRHFFVLEN